MPILYEWSFQAGWKCKNKHKKLFSSVKPSFWRTSTRQKGLSDSGLAIWNRIPKIFLKTKNWNTFEHKMKHYYLNDLSNSNLRNIGGFNYALAIIKNIFIFFKQIFLHLFFPASLWLKDHNENKAICLFCVVLPIFFLINITININIFG